MKERPESVTLCVNDVQERTLPFPDARVMLEMVVDVVTRVDVLLRVKSGASVSEGVRDALMFISVSVSIPLDVTATNEHALPSLRARVREKSLSSSEPDVTANTTEEELKEDVMVRVAVDVAFSLL